MIWGAVLRVRSIAFVAMTRLVCCENQLTHDILLPELKKEKEHQ